MDKLRRWAAILLLGTFVASLAIEPASARPSLSSLRQRLNLNSRRINDVQRNLRYLKRKHRTVAQQLGTAKKKLEVTRATLRDTQAQLRSTRRKLEATRAELAILEKRLKERNDLLAERLADTYKHGSVSYLSVLLGAADFWDLLSRGYVVRKVLNSDIELVEAIKEDKKAVEEKKAVLEKQEREREELERKHRALTMAAQAQTAECERLLKDITRDRVKYEQMLAALEADSRSIAAMVRKLQSSSARRSGGTVPRWTGGYGWPVSGRVTSGFGMRYHPILKSRRMHTGVDIAAPYGTTISAAAGGKVIYAGWFGAYGNTVIIDHGGGTITFYGHCSSFLVRSGVSVKQGQAIARVGSTGLSTGPHVHFEKQRNGVPVSPF